MEIGKRKKEEHEHLMETMASFIFNSKMSSRSIDRSTGDGNGGREGRGVNERKGQLLQPHNHDRSKKKKYNKAILISSDFSCPQFFSLHYQPSRCLVDFHKYPFRMNEMNERIYKYINQVC
ncbi:hypothetical protein HMI54_014111 [Coelomomyces lativittatus]|nr:hypothetical protein HMI54_014111 [Coelomomyces lativittatus]KAJ1500452.1 hypothetical protein HMI55_003883 [Coelomomyces lativittatus]KAJ1501418.1 hypothetical protein HMI56_003249 [Coelomomyces lativittatus]